MLSFGRSSRGFLNIIKHKNDQPLKTLPFFMVGFFAYLPSVIPLLCHHFLPEKKDFQNPYLQPGPRDGPVLWIWVRTQHLEPTGKMCNQSPINSSPFDIYNIWQWEEAQWLESQFFSIYFAWALRQTLCFTWNTALRYFHPVRQDQPTTDVLGILYFWT